jgi:phage FluMu protein gp41
MKTTVYAHNVITRKELLQRILSAVGSINKAASLRKVTSSLITGVRKGIQADGGHFEKFA